MSTVRLNLVGMDELRAALRNLPASMTPDAGAIVVEFATKAQHAVQDGYPVGPPRKNYPGGNLKHNVRLTVEQSKGGVIARVRSSAKHAFIFENGTKVRQTRTGANRGAMPKAPESSAAIPKFIRYRREMREALITLVERAGFTVTR